MKGYRFNLIQFFFSKRDGHVGRQFITISRQWLEYLEIGVTVELTEGESGNVICYKDVPRQWNEERDYLYPIPRQDRILTNGALTQNPGWNDNLNF